MKPLRHVAIAAAALALTGACAFADDISTAVAPDTSNAVFVGGTPIYRVRVGGGGYTPEQRAVEIQDRVNDCLSIGPIMPEDITVSPVGDEYAVYVKGRLMLTADMATARYNQSTPYDLANRWAHHLREVLPGLTENP